MQFVNLNMKESSSIILSHSQYKIIKAGQHYNRFADTIADIFERQMRFDTFESGKKKNVVD